MWLFELAISIWFGYELVASLSSPFFDSLQQLLCGSVIGFIVNSWIVFFISYPIGLTPFCGTLSMIILAVFAYLLHQKNGRLSKSKNNFIFHLTNLQMVTYALFGIIYFLFMNASQFYDHQRSKGAGYSDMPFHLNIINSFSVGCNNPRKSFFGIISAFYAGEPLAYPFIPNYHAAMLMNTGFTSARYALFIPSLFICYSLLVGLYSLTYYFSKSHVSCLISLILFTNLGGLAWTHLFDPKHRLDPRRDWIHDWGNNQHEYWFHPIMHIIIPQRAAMWSLPLCVWTTLCLVIGCELKNHKMLILAGVMTGLMPQVQVHSYVAIAQYSVSLFLLMFPWKDYRNQEKVKKYIIFWSYFAITANVIAVPQLYPYFMRVSHQKNQFLQVKPIWKGRSSVQKSWFKPILLWWRGLGIFAFISLVSGWILMTKWQMTMYIPSVIVFLLTNIIRYQPWEMDNTKLFYAGWVPLALAVVSNYISYFIITPKTLLRKIFGYSVAFIFIIGCTLSAFMSTTQSMFFPTRLYEPDDYKFGLWIAENTPPDAVFLFRSSPHNPIASIAGRQVFLGYDGWVQSHGLDLSRRYTEQYLMKNPNDIDAFHRNGISYVATCGWCAFKDFSGNSSIWKNIFDSGRYKVYRLLV
ncbi:hypothetical protein TRFO_19012 [Tritrichomonas foetus]|uniref:Uncharacterized protein n=1 Tax=Tritrichomonas foetus TaxID=1144522 RepID=A0A1J4KP46_9EUKA|nr:hypothetical protein TRFO_19012 [Tritrichomonas foetus]|eukprot:OHT11478.1 hypothetical protein TRFO_19012 [Tritrichomonas foetus]